MLTLFLPQTGVGLPRPIDPSTGLMAIPGTGYYCSVLFLEIYVSAAAGGVPATILVIDDIHYVAREGETFSY